MIYKALTIAGSDNSGGAGIQADLKVFSAFGVYGMSAVTSITVQDTSGVIGSYPVSAEILYNQIKTVVKDIGIDAFKIGMLQTEANVLAVYQAVTELKMKNLVSDTVIKSSNGKYLLDRSALETFIKKIIPITDILTPNKDEAEQLTGIKIESVNDMIRAAKELHKMGASTVVVKGGHMPQNGKVIDVVYKEDIDLIEYPYVDTENTHGTGCTFSAAITACLAKGYSHLKSIKIARSYIQGALENSLDIGKGKGSLNHFWTVV